MAATTSSTWIGCTSWGASPKRTAKGIEASALNTRALAPSLPYTSEGWTMAARTGSDAR
jgi:hypothetical protein